MNFTRTNTKRLVTLLVVLVVSAACLVTVAYAYNAEYHNTIESQDVTVTSTNSYITITSTGLSNPENVNVEVKAVYSDTITSASGTEYVLDDSKTKHTFTFPDNRQYTFDETTDILSIKLGELTVSKVNADVQSVTLSVTEATQVSGDHDSIFQEDLNKFSFLFTDSDGNALTTNKIVFSESTVKISVWTQAKLNDSFIPKNTNSENEMVSTSTASLPGFSSLTIKASDITVTGSNGSASVTESTENVIILTTATAEEGSDQTEPLEITAVFNEIPADAEKFEATYSADDDGVVQLNLSLNNSSEENVFTNGDATITMTLNGEYDTLRFFDSTTDSNSEQPKAYFKYAYDENGSVKTTTITFTTTHFSKFVAFLNSTGFQFPATSAEDIQFAFNMGVNVKLTSDTTVKSQIVLKTGTVELNLNGKTLTTSVSKDEVFTLERGSTLTIDGTSDKSVVTSSVNDTYGFFGMTDAKLILNGGTYTATTARLADDAGYFADGALIYAHLCELNEETGNTIVMNNVTATTDDRVVWSDYGGLRSITVNGGTYTASATAVSGNPMYAIFGIDVTYSTAFDNTSGPTTVNGTAIFNNVKATSAGGAVIEMGGGIDIVTDCEFTVTAVSDPAWVASALAVSYQADCTISGGSFTSNSGTTSHPSYGLYIYSSGGKLAVDNATVNATVALEADSTKSSLANLSIRSGQYTGSIGTNGSCSSISITGGTFSVDPSAYCTTGYTALISEDKWTVTDTVYVSSNEHGTGLTAESPMDFYYTSNQTYPSLFRTLGSNEHILDEKFKGCTVYIVGNIVGYAKNYLPVSVTIKGYGTDASFGQTLTLCNIANANKFVGNGTPQYSSDSNAVITIENIALKGSGNGSAVGIYGDSDNTMSLVLDHVKIDVTNCGAAVSFKNTTGSLTVKNCTITNNNVTNTNQHNAIVTANTGAVSITGTQMSGFNRTVNITTATSVTTGNNAVNVLYDGNKTIVYQVSSMNNASVIIGKDRSLAYTALDNTVTKSSETYYVTIHDEDNKFTTLSSALDITFLAPDKGNSAITSTIENFTLTNGSTATVQDGVTLAVTNKHIESGSSLVYLVGSGSSLEYALKPTGSTPVPDIVRLVNDITAGSWKVISIANPLTLDGN